VNIQTDRALIPAGATAVRYLTVTITAPARPQKTERPSVDVALVLDRSGSMAGRKIDNARKAVEHAVRLLNERDRLALVCYDTEIDTLLSSTPATPEAKTLALSRLRAIDARGSTDLCGGWLRGAEELTAHGGVSPGSRQSGTDPSICRVMLLSDGLANHGETDSTALARHAADLRAKGITTSTFGLGADFDETLMSRLATDGGGHFYFIEQPAQIPDFFTSELGEALEVVARDARLVIAVDAGVEVACLNGFPVETTAGSAGGAVDLHVRLGDLVSAQQLTVVIAVRCQPRADDGRATVTLRLADRDHALFPQPMPVEWRATNATADAAQPVNTGVLIEVARLMAERARAAALDANRRGDFAQATAILTAAAAELRALAPGVREVELLAAELDVEEVDYAREMMPAEMKQRQFSTYNASFSRSAKGSARRRPAP
jgi:Ca-activated chloride channel family protein